MVYKFNNCLYFWNTEEQSVVTGFTLHKLIDMRTRVGKPRPLLDQEKLDLFRDASRKGHDSIIVAKKFDRLVADVERKMRAALRRLKEMLTGLD
ncbi:hypothetical protein DPMN_107983 [Dreissena polymorpha]|uniref:Uncharacterized protein n=1 Tax=Dreissena polymorpha TaxID=45954 RepID=A0A9D4K7W9_DREPO|nr:hypothetical protein DPMN_107983 [Dreissena polymorpha]